MHIPANLVAAQRVLNHVAMLGVKLIIDKPELQLQPFTVVAKIILIENCNGIVYPAVAVADLQGVCFKK